MLADVPRRASFVACSVVQMCALLSSFVNTQSKTAIDALGLADGGGAAHGVPTVYLVIGVVLVIAVIALFGNSLQNQKLPRAFWLGIAAFLLAGAALVYVHVSEDSLLPFTAVAMKVTVVLALAVLMLSIFRTSPVWYVATAVVAGAVISASADPVNLTYGLLSGFSVVLAWAVLNYGVQLFLDHDAELATIWSMPLRAKVRAMIRALFLMTPVLVLCVIGWRAHEALQVQMLEIPYAETTFREDGKRFIVTCEGSPGPLDAAQLEKDLLCTLKDEEETSVDQMIDNVDAWAASGLNLTTQTPKEVAAQLGKLTPPQINGRQACNGFTYSKKFVKLSFTSPCRGLVGYINQAMSRTHDRVTERIQRTTEAASANAKKGIHQSEAELKETLERDIRASYKAGKSAVEATFVCITFLEYLSFSILLVSIVAAFQMIQGRVLFNRPNEGKAGMSFQLAAGTAQPVEKITRHSMTLSDDASEKTTWFAKLTLARRGTGTAQRISVPQPLKCMVSRLTAGVYFLTRIDVERGSNAPVVSVAGDTKLVRISVKPGQSLCFRMSDLVGFTAGVRLRSRYSTHVGTHLLRLGTFYSIVEGSGFVLLSTEGEQIAATSPGESTPTTNLLVWDEAHAFALDQHLGMSSLWLNPPSLVSLSVSGSGVTDEGASERFPILARIWGLFRYLFLPM